MGAKVVVEVVVVVVVVEGEEGSSAALSSSAHHLGKEAAAAEEEEDCPQIGRCTVMRTMRSIIGTRGYGPHRGRGRRGAIRKA